MNRFEQDEKDAGVHQIHLIDVRQDPGSPRNAENHSKWDLVGYSGCSPGLENAVKRWGRPIGPICFFCLLRCKPVVFHLRVNLRARPSKRNASP